MFFLAWYKVASQSLERIQRETLLTQEEKQMKEKKVYLDVKIYYHYVIEILLTSSIFTPPPPIFTNYIFHEIIILSY